MLAAAGETVAWGAPTRSHVVTDVLATLPHDGLVAFCYYDGAFSAPSMPGAEPYTRALYIIPANGEPIQFAVGSAKTIPVLGPSVAAP